jgi:GT2 family glycosyltransferase
MASGLNGRPLVSIFMFVRNGAKSIRRAIDSVLAQTYSNIEFIVQDGASTDGTLDILRGYGEQLKVVSEHDSGPNEGLWRALNRCTGTVIGSCLADEELMPDAVKCAVDLLLYEPDVVAITSDAIITDIDGVQTGVWKSGPFNLVDYLLCDYTPYFCSTFFRRQALLEAGLQSEKWGMKSVEFELWCRLATHGRIKYVSGTNAKYASHADQSSNNARDVAVHFGGRLDKILSMCSANGFFGASPLLRTLFVWGHARAFINHAIAFKRPEIADTLYKITKDTLSVFPPVLLDGKLYDENYGSPELAETGSKPSTSSPLLRRLVERLSGPRTEVQTTPQYVLPPPIDRRLKARMYVQLALRYEAGMREREALETWKSAAIQADPMALEGIRPLMEERVGYTATERS